MLMRRTEGWAARFTGVGINKELWSLITGQCSQYGGGRGGGFCRKKKDFGKPPCQFLMYWGGICILKNIVKYCKILYLKYVLIV